MRNGRSMNVMITLLLILNFCLVHADNFEMAYKMYLGSPNLEIPVSTLVNCARKLKWIGVGFSLDPVSNTCISLNESWLALKQTNEGEVHMENTIRSQEFLPPKNLYHLNEGRENYFEDLPIDFKNGSSVTFYIYIKLRTSGISITLQKGRDMVFKAKLFPGRSNIQYLSKYNNTPSEPMIIDREIAVNKTEKFTFRVVRIGGFEIYQNDELIGLYTDDRTPHSTYGFQKVIIVMGRNTEFNLERIIYNQ